jgi:pimeloyl-ACP methyl ester carboxylesterase
VDARRIDIGDLQLAVLEAGAGGTPLLLVHGFTGAKEDFAEEIDRLAALGHHVVAPDHRGHGASDQPAAETAYSLAIFVTDMWALADALGWERFDLLGHSMGGMVAQMMVLEAPDRIDRLVLMDTHHGPIGGLDPELLTLGVELARNDGLLVIQELLKAGKDPLENPAHERVCREREGYAAWSDAKMLACSPAMYAAMLSHFDEVEDRLDELATIDHETLVLVGELDEPFLGASSRLADAIPRARLSVLTQGGHSPQFEATEEWRRAVDDFLGATRTVAGRGASAGAPPG